MMRIACAAIARIGEERAWLMASSELIPSQPRLHGEEIEAHAGKDDEEHHRSDRCAHVRVAELQLEAEEGAIEESTEDVGREVGAGERALRYIDQVEGVEIAHEGKD